MKKIKLVIIAALLVLTSCEIIDVLLKSAVQSTIPTDQEVIQGLKKALEIGTNTAVSSLNKKDGFYLHPLLKITLPKEVQDVMNIALNNAYIKQTGMNKILEDKIEKFVLAINRSAESAVIEAKPIFINAITTLTITQGMDILKGTDIRGQVKNFDSLAATHYLEFKTRNQLFNLFKPKFDPILNRDLGIGISANDAWDQLTSYYNNYIAPIINKPKITYSLSDYATNKTLDGLFYMIGQEEKKIRLNPYQYTYDIIKKVFGYVKK